MFWLRALGQSTGDDRRWAFDEQDRDETKIEVSEETRLLDRLRQQVRRTNIGHRQRDDSRRRAPSSKILREIIQRKGKSLPSDDIHAVYKPDPMYLSSRSVLISARSTLLALIKTRLYESAVISN